MQCRVLGGIAGCGPDDGGYVVPICGQPAVMLSEMVRSYPAAASVDRLTLALWQDDSPRTARAGVQTVATRLRRTLGPAAVKFEADAYRLDLPADAIDVCVFHRLAATAAAQLTDGSFEACLASAEAALDLWRGPPFGALRSSLDLAGFALVLENALARLQETQLGALFGLDRVQLAADYAAELVAAEPFREQRWRDLMLALYRSGRTAEALNAYQRLRRLLADELGIEPHGDTRELELAILRQDEAALR